MTQTKDAISEQEQLANQLQELLDSKDNLVKPDPMTATLKDIRQYSELLESLDFEADQLRYKIAKSWESRVSEGFEAARSKAQAAELKVDVEREKVRAALTTAGTGIESEQAWPHNQRAAKQAFDHRVERSAKVMKAKAESEVAKQEYNTLVQEAGNYRLDAEEVQRRLLDWK